MPALGDATNRDIKALRPPAAQPRKGPPRAPATRATALAPQAATASHAAEASLLDLPGIEDDVAPPPGPRRGRLPLASNADAQSFFGSAFARGGQQGSSIRVVSVPRNPTARRQGTLRLVAQPDEAEGRRLSRLPLGERPGVKARTAPLRSGRLVGGTGSSSSTGSSSPSNGLAPSLDSSRATPSAAALAPLPEAAVAATPPPQGTLSSGSGPQAQPAGAALPPTLPLPRRRRSPPTASAAAALREPASEQLAPCALGAAAVEPPPAASPAGTTCSSNRCADQREEGVSSADVAGPVGGTAPPCLQPPAQQQGAGASCSRTATVDAACMPPPLLRVRSSDAAAAWRGMWLAGMQAHNASRSGQPIRAGSRWHFIPLDVNDPLLTVLMFKTAVMPEQVVSGAARFQDIVQGCPDLHAEALAAGVLSYGLWGVPATDGSYQLLADGKQIALPISFRAAPPHTVALFLACVWHEANRAEAAAHASYAFAADGQRSADTPHLKYSPDELLEWVELALGCEQAAAESVAALAHVAQFGAE